MPAADTRRQTHGFVSIRLIQVPPMNAIAEASPRVAARFQPQGKVVIDCHVKSIYYGKFHAVRDSVVPDLSVLPVAARARCCAASTA